MAGFEALTGATVDGDAAALPRPANEAATPDGAQQRLDLLNAVIDLLPVGVRVDAADGRLILANSAASQVPLHANATAPVSAL